MPPPICSPDMILLPCTVFFILKITMPSMIFQHHSNFLHGLTIHNSYLCIRFGKDGEIQFSHHVGFGFNIFHKDIT